ncbi:hypothetical protein HK100_001334 [Physocladia obscura]|uniref:Uncharacterized protein n=1 Tax=Physocladia obscura TaxID=109957 RepID=A0AAD5T7L9_9FUNG|nr:hypothetical protein HK100_001334 [Physocladia obscura]
MSSKAQPRPYQLELLSAALTRNIIAFLDTGAGKTLISILLMENLSQDLIPVSRSDIEAMLRGDSGANSVLFNNQTKISQVEIDGFTLPRQPKKIVFLAPTVSLVNQQAEKIRNSCDLIVGEYSRDDSTSVSYWDRLGWYSEMSCHHVLIFTPQVFLNTMRHGFINISTDVALIVFDECHHAWKNHPYNLLMKEFYHTLPPDAEKPKILGMTASPIYQKSTTIDVALQGLVELQQSLDCHIVTISDRNMLEGHISHAKEYLVEFNPSQNGIFDLVISGNIALESNSPELKKLDEEHEEQVARCLNLIKELETDLGSWCAGRLAVRLFNSIWQGSSSSSSTDKMSSNIQQKTLDRFRCGEVNLLVVTKVAEEGIDIPACKLIVIFDLFRSNSGYVQSRGRARDIHGSEYIIMVKRHDMHALDVISQAKVSEMMTRTLVSSLTANTDQNSSSISVVKSETDNAVIDELVGVDDVYATNLTTVLPSGFNSILSRFLKRKPEYSVFIEGSQKINPSLWAKYFELKSKQDSISSITPDPFANDRFESKFKEQISSGFAYKLKVLKSFQSSETVEIVGSVRFTRKLAIQSAGLEAIKYLHRTGALNDHLLPAGLAKRKATAFAFRRLLEIKTNYEDEANGKLKTLQQFVFDSALGENQSDASFVVEQKVPDCFVHSEKWIEICSEAEDSQRLDSMQFYAAIVSFGPEFEELSQNIYNSPIINIQNILNNDERVLNQPKRTLAILTLAPIPTEVIPDIPMFLGQDPCTVKILNIGFEKIIRIAKSELEKLRSFQSKFWNIVLHHQNTKIPDNTAEQMKNIKDTSSMFMIAPVLGYFKKEAFENFEWVFDWNLVSAVDEERRVPLHNWIAVLEKKIAQTKTDSPSDLKDGLKVHTKSIAFGGMNLLDPIYDPANNIDSDLEFESDLEVEKNENTLLDVVQSLGIGQEQKLRKRKRNEREKIISVEINFQTDIKYFDTVPSFDTVFDFLQEHNTTQNGSWERLRSSSRIATKLNMLLCQTILQTHHNGMVYIPNELACHLNVNSPFTTEKFADVSSFADYFEKLGYNLQHNDAPMLEVFKVPALRSYTRPFEPSILSPDSAKIYLPLDACNVLPVPAELFKIAQILPSILSRVETFCLIEETRKKLELTNISINTMLQAFTATSALESYSYERLETLGDSFLKFACSANLIKQNPTFNEGDLSKLRGHIVSNKNLCEISRKFELGGLMVISPFKARVWSPPRVFWKDNQSITILQRRFSEKKLADFVEALIGAAFIDSGAESSWKLLSRFGLINQEALLDLAKPEFYLDFKMDEHLLVNNNAQLVDVDTKNIGGNDLSVEILELQIGYKFREKNLALQAITHKSFAGKTHSYEILEFLGDAILDWIIMQYVFGQYLNLSPEKLTELRQAAVNSESFCRLAVSTGLYRFLLHSSPILERQIQAYLSYLLLTGAMNSSPGEAIQEGPKVLGDLFEAIVGAIYMDSNYSLAAVWNALKPMISPFLTKYVTPEVVEKSPIRQMHEYYQGLGFTPENILYQYEETEENGIAEIVTTVFLVDESIGCGSGNTKQLSKRRATIAALKWADSNKLKIDHLLLTRQKCSPQSLKTEKLKRVEKRDEVIENKPDPSNFHETNNEETNSCSRKSLHEPQSFSIFTSFLAALEMNELNQLKVHPTSSSSVNYFLMQLMAIQQQERLQLQAIQNEQLQLLLKKSKS